VPPEGVRVSWERRMDGRDGAGSTERINASHTDGAGGSARGRRARARKKRSADHTKYGNPASGSTQPVSAACRSPGSRPGSGRRRPTRCRCCGSGS
jgi:hypothetical protein